MTNKQTNTKTKSKIIKKAKKTKKKLNKKKINNKNQSLISQIKNTQFKTLEKYSNGIFKIYQILINIYNNVELELITTKIPLKNNIPSYYKCFLYCVRNHIYFKKEVVHIKKFFDLETIYSFDNDDIDNMDLSQKQLTRLNNIVEDNCPRLIKAFNPLDPQYNIPAEHNFLYNIYMSFQGFELIRYQMTHKIQVKYKYKLQSELLTQEHLNKDKNIDLDLDLEGLFNIYVKKRDILESKFKLSSSPFLKQIATRILFYNVYLSTSRIPLFIIYYCNLKKVLNTPLNDNKLRSININTAATDTDTKIIIWRKEELLKSIFHECNHFHKLDRILNFNMEDINKFIFNKIRIDKQSYDQLELRETYTEMTANLLNIIGVTSFKEPYLKNNDDCFSFVSRYLTKEINFSINQVGKILKHFNFKNMFQFLKSSSKSTELLSQSTHVVSYYILKSITLINIGLIIQENSDISQNIVLNLNEKGKKTLFSCIKKNLNEESLWTKMVNKSMNTKTFKNKTLKMTSVSSD